MEHRSSRLASVIRQEIAKDITRTLEFPGMLVTVTEVELNHKMDVATVHVSVMPEEKAQESLNTLERERRTMERRLLRRLGIRFMPELRFRLDHGPANAANVDRLLNENPLDEQLFGGGSSV